MPHNTALCYVTVTNSYFLFAFLELERIFFLIKWPFLIIYFYFMRTDVRPSDMSGKGGGPGEGRVEIGLLCVSLAVLELAQ